MFIGTPKLLKQTHVTDGTANTIAIVEADRAVEWTKPEDWSFDRSKPTDGLGQLWGGVFNASYVDGSIHRIQLDKPADEIGILFTRNGGETKNLQQSTGRNSDPNSIAEGVDVETVRAARLGACHAQARDTAPVLKRSVGEKYFVRIPQSRSRFCRGT